VLIPGEYRLAEEAIECHQTRTVKKVRVANTGDRPVQVGSHFHFAEVNPQLLFNRREAIGMRLNIPAGTAVRFEPGEEKMIEMVQIGGARKVYGLHGATQGSVEAEERISQRLKKLGMKGVE